MAQLTGVLAGRRKRAHPWLLGITHDEAAPASLGLPLPLLLAFWKVHPLPTQPGCPGDTVAVVTEGGPVGEHRKGPVQATHGLCRY